MADQEEVQDAVVWAGAMFVYVDHDGVLYHVQETRFLTPTG